MRYNKFFHIPTVFICVVLLLGSVNTAAADSGTRRLLIPGGMPFGVRLCCEGVLVVGVGDVSVDSVKRSPARDAGIRPRDVICEIDGAAVSGADDVVAAVSESGGKRLSVGLKRGDERLSVELTPLPSDEDGKLRTGLWIRDSAAGIGTVTFIDPETGAFAGLGHGICDAETGELMPLRRGVVVGVSISGVVKGCVGSPGELRGSFCTGKLGSLIGNTECGVYGVFSELPAPPLCEPLPVASASEIHEGEAELLCTADNGGIRRYKIKLSEVDRTGRDVKNFVVSIVDGELLKLTGGIVQGMSGSPIIQDGRLIGAVTHVLINNPAKGYGIFIENMLSKMPLTIKVAD